MGWDARAANDYHCDGERRENFGLALGPDRVIEFLYRHKSTFFVELAHDQGRPPNLSRSICIGSTVLIGLISIVSRVSRQVAELGQHAQSMEMGRKSVGLGVAFDVANRDSQAVVDCESDVSRVVGHLGQRLSRHPVEGVHQPSW